MKTRGWVKDGVYHKNERERGVLHFVAGGAWSVNMQEIFSLRANECLREIVYHTEKADYSISYEDAFKFGFPKVFGGERKLIIPRKFWDKKELISK